MILLLGFAACYAQTNRQNEAAKPPDKDKVLIVYLSRTGNTEAVARMIQNEVGGDLVPIELEKPYPADYQTTVAQVARENETGFLPPLKTKIEDIGRYDTIFVGFPTWGMQLPPPMKSLGAGSKILDRADSRNHKAASPRRKSRRGRCRIVGRRSARTRPTDVSGQGHGSKIRRRFAKIGQSVK